MNTRITKKILFRTFRHDFRRFLSISQIVEKNSPIGLNSAQHRKGYYSSSFLFTKNVGKNFPTHIPVPTYIVFQKRNISNDTNVSVKLPQVSDLPPVNDPVNIVSVLPKYLTTFSDWKIVEVAQKTLLHVHETTGLPWWATIALTAFGARTVVTLPFSIIQVHNTAKLQVLQDEMKDIVKTLKHEANRAVSYHGWPEDLARKEYKKKLKHEWKELIVRDNCHPAKSYILLLIQLPLWFSFSIATRNLCYMLPRPDASAEVTFLEMTVGGFGWVTNLTTVDPYMALPFMLTLVNLTILETHRLFSIKELTKWEKWSGYFFRTISIIMLPLAACMPVATNIYWLTSSSFGLLQAFMLHSTRLRRLFRVPVTETELQHPYRLFYGNLKSRLRLSAK